MNLHEKKFTEAEAIAEIKKSHPRISDDKIKEVFSGFKEQQKTVDDCMAEIQRAVSNALKIGQNLKFPPEPYAALLSEKILNHALKLQSSAFTATLESLIDAKKEIYYIKNK